MSESRPEGMAERLPRVETLEQTLHNIKDSVRDRMERQGVPEFQTGLDPIDGGLFGLHRTQLTTVAARPGCGKTSFACQIAFNLANLGRTVVFLSLEMSRETILERIFCQINKVDSFKMLTGVVDVTVLDQIDDFVGVCKELPLTIIDDYCHTSDELFKLFEYLKCRPDVLILDHIQHIRSKDYRRTDREHINDYLKYLKEFTVKYKVATMILSQISREGEGEPTLNTLKGSGTIEEISDHVLILHMDRSDEAKKPTKITVAKNRFGPVGKYTMMYDAPCCFFRNIPVVKSLTDISL